MIGTWRNEVYKEGEMSDEKVVKIKKGPTFIHYRVIENGVIQPRGGMTVCARWKAGFLDVGVAFCNQLDHYNKHVGRVKAEGRMHSTDRHIISQQDYSDSCVLSIAEYAKSLLKLGILPSYASVSAWQRVLVYTAMNFDNNGHRRKYV